MINKHKIEEPFQIRWDPELKKTFEALLKDYDQDLSINKAVTKLVRYAVKEYWIPGYERKAKAIETLKEVKTGYLSLDKVKISDKIIPPKGELIE